MIPSAGSRPFVMARYLSIEFVTEVLEALLSLPAQFWPA